MNSERSIWADHPDILPELVLPDDLDMVQVAQLVPKNIQDPREHLERSSLIMWKNIPIEAERKLLDAEYPMGWYINRDEKICPLGEKQKKGGLTPERIAYLWQRFPGGWYFGTYDTIYACPGAITERVSLTIQQVTEILNLGDFLQEFHQFQLDLKNTVTQTIKHKSFSAALRKISEVLENKKYPLSEAENGTLHACIEETLVVFPINLIPKNNDKVSTKISHYIELYISLKRMQRILEKKTSRPF